jgi:hypothetical protein
MSRHAQIQSKDSPTKDVFSLSYQQRNTNEGTDFRHTADALEQVWSRLVTGITGSKPAEGMGVFLLCLLCVV